MAIGAHELLLIVRAQNQASNMLSRVSRDFRRLQNMKDLDVARSRAVNQMAANAVQMQQKMARIGSVVNADGVKRLQNEQAIAKNLLTQATLRQNLSRLTASGGSGTAAYIKMNEQLKIAQRQLKIIDSQWRETIALTEAEAKSLDVIIERDRQIALALKEINAEQAMQGSVKRDILTGTVGHIGRILSTMGLIGVAAFGAMAVSAAHFNQQAILAATQVGKIGSNSETVVANGTRIEKAIEGIMTVIPANQNELTSALYNIYSSMNATFGQGTQLLKLFGQVWVAGGMQGSITDVSDALITLANNWHISASNMGAFQKLAASTMATVRFGRLTVEQYTQTMNQLAPAFHGAHQSIEQMNGALAFLTRLLPGTGVTAAGIARMMEQFQRFAASPKPGFEGLAKAIQTPQGNLKPLNEVLATIIKAMPELQTSGVALTNFFKTVSGNQGTVQARRALQGFILNFKQYQQILKQTRGDQNEFNRSLKAMERSTGVRWAQFINDMRVLGLELGSVVLPALLKMVQPLMSLVKWFNNLSGSEKKFYGEILAGGAALTLLIGALATITASLVFMGKNLKIAAKALGLYATEAEGAEAATVGLRLAMIPEIAVVGLLIGGLMKASAWLANFDRGSSTINLTTNKLKELRIEASHLNQGWARTGITKQIDEWQKLGRNIGELKKMFDLMPSWARKGFHLILDPTVMRKLQENMNRMATAFQPMPGTTDVAMPKATLEQRFRDMYPFLDDKTIDRMATKALKSIYHAQSQFTQASRLANFGALPSGSRGQTTAAFTNKEFLDAIRHASELKQAMDKQGLTLQQEQIAYNAYTQFVAKATENMTKVQKKAFQDLLSWMEGQAKAAIHHTDQTVLNYAKRVAALQKIFDKDPTLKNRQALQKALNALDKIGNSDQVQMANDVLSQQKQNEDARVQAAKDAAEKRKQLRQKELEDAKQALEKQKQIQQQAAQNVQSATQTILGIYQNALQQYQGYLGQIFQGPWMTGSIMQNRQQFGFSARPSDLVNDMRLSTTHAERFTKSLDRLRGRATGVVGKTVAGELVDQIAQLGPDAQKQLGVIGQMSAAQFREWVGYFKRGQQDAKVYADRAMKDRLKEWMKFGRNVALAIATGVRSENVALENAMREMIERMFPGLKVRATPIHQRHRGTTGNRGQSSGGETVHYHINMQGYGWEAALRRAHFTQKNRKR